MNIPGFTAEASFSRTGELYHMRSMDAIATGQVVPQFPKDQAACKTECKGTSPTLNWSVACDDYCRCLFASTNPAATCQSDFKEDTGQPPPFRLRSVAAGIFGGNVVRFSA
jgi:hypothetical protein